MSLPDKSPQLSIRRVKVTGHLGCDIQLDSGLNIVKGEIIDGEATTSNDCGKTTFTELIKYGLGDRDRFSNGAIAEKIDQLFLEISCNNELFTIQRDLNKPSARIHIYRDEISNRLEKSNADYEVSPKTQYSDFLLEHLRIPRIMIPLSKRPGTAATPLTFQTYMRLFYMDQVNSFQRILNKVQPDWLPGRMVSILLGLTPEELESLRVRHQELTNQIDELTRQITNIADFLMKSGGMNRLGINESIQAFQKDLDIVTDQIKDVKLQMRALSIGRTDSLRSSLDTLNRQRSTINDELAKLQFKLYDFELLRSSLLTDRDKARKMDESIHILSSVSFHQCPRCLQTITEEMMDRELQSECMLCARPLRVADHRPMALAKGDIVDEEIAEVEILIAGYREKVEVLVSRLAPDLVEIEKLQKELDSATSQYVSPFVDSLEQLLYEQNAIVVRIQTLEQQLHQWHMVDRLEDRLVDLQNERTEVSKKIDLYDSQDISAIRQLSEIYESFLQRVSGSTAERAHIDTKSMLPLVNGVDYTEDVGIGMQSVRTIAYHYTLLEYSLRQPSYYPRFLMVDSPRAFDLNQDTYEKLLLQFERLVDVYADNSFQVILTTRDLPTSMDKFVVERLNRKNRMLLRSTGDRRQVSVPFDLH